MPIGFTSAARNLFLLGSAGADLVTNFFKTIDQSSTTDGVFTARDIKYLYSEERYLLAGLALNSQGKSFGFHEKRQEDGTEDWSVKTQSTDPTNNVTLTSLELDSNGNLLVGGLANNAPWIARYTTAGVLQWTSTTNTGNGRYFGLAVDSDDNYYGAGRTKRNNPLITDDGFRSSAILEKYDNNGNTVWGKSVSVTGENVCFNKVDATSTSIIAAGYLGDGIGKGYLAKFDKSNGEMQWDRTIVSNVKNDLGVQEQTSIEDIHVDPDGNIYLCGTLFLADSEDDEHKKGRGFVIKYSAEGNLLWQQEVGVPGLVSYYQYYNISVDDNTRQVVVFGRTYNASSTYGAGLLTKLSSSGQILWNRRLLSDRVPPTLNHFSRRSGFDADPSFYYVFFTDDNNNLLNGTPDEYTFGRVSSSGNGLGAFQYEPQTGINIDYEIINPATRIGKLQDGSIRNDSSDLTSYPFSALKVSFDDYATPITNKKAILSDKDLVQRSGSPAIRPVDFMELDLGDESFDVFVPAQEELYDQVGTYSFDVPAGVTEISAVAIGGGGGAAFCTGSNASSAGGGGGGGTAWGTFTVTPGETLTVVVGTGGMGGESAGAIAGASGGNSTISRGGTTLLNGGGGAGGVADAPATNSSYGTAAAGGTSTGSERDGGGSGGLGGHPRHNFGGGGGGGAGGYNGNGGQGGSGNGSGSVGLSGPAGGQGTGGGGGGGGGQGTGGEQNNGGGGIGIYGGPINGAGGANDSPGGRGSNGQGGQPGGDGGLFGGGGGGREDDTSGAGGTGGSGGVRIIWGAGRSFPDNAQRDLSSTETKVTDKSGNGNVGTVKGATLNAGGYFEFDGDDDFIDLGTQPIDSDLNASSPSGGGLTVEWWGFYNGTGDSFQRIIDRSNSGGAGNGWAIYTGGVGSTTNIRLSVDGESTLLTSTELIDANVWQHWMVSWNQGSGDWAWYKNGVAAGTGNATYSIPAVETGMRIGTWNHSTGREYNGRIAEVRVYPRSLTEAQVFQNYNSTKSKYINEAPDTAPKIGPGIASDSNLLLNYDFGNRATYDDAHNEIRDSTEFTAFSTVNTVKTLNAAKAPDGSMSAVKIERGTTGSSTWYTDFVSTIPANNAGTYTYSVWMRGPDGFTGGARIALLEQTGGNTEISVNITDQWQQYSVTKTYDGSFSTNIRVHPVIFRNQPGAIDAGKVVPDFVYLWHPQLEKASTTGRYVPTYGSVITKPTTFKNLIGSDYNETIPSDWEFTNDSFTSDGSGQFSNNAILTFDPVIPHENNFAAGWAWEGWVKINNFTNISNAYLFRSTASGTNAGAYIAQSVAIQGKLFLERDNGGASGPNNNLMPDGIAEGVWSYFVVTGTHGSTYYQYYNGSAVGAYAASANFVPNRLARFGSGTGVDMSFGELRVWDRELSAAEILQNYNATRGKYGV